MLSMEIPGTTLMTYLGNHSALLNPLPQEIGACEMRVFRGDGCYLRGRDTETLASQQVGTVTASCEKIASLPKFISQEFPRGSAWPIRSSKDPQRLPTAFPTKFCSPGHSQLSLIGLHPFFPALFSSNAIVRFTVQ